MIFYKYLKILLFEHLWEILVFRMSLLWLVVNLLVHNDSLFKYFTSHEKKMKICLNLSYLCIDALMHILKIWCFLYYGLKNIKVDFHMLGFWPDKSWGSLAHKLEHNIFKFEVGWKNGKLNPKNILLKM